MLRYNIETLNPDHRDTIIGVLDADGDGQQIAAVWIAKEHLRDLLALRATRTHITPAPSAVRDKLASFYTWCADNDGIPEITALEDYRKMAAARHRRRPHRLLERESRGP
jgi:hypothetical protein